MVTRRRSLKSVQSLHPSTANRRRHAFSRFAADHLNFYRVHLALFIFIPLICSGVFYALDTNEFTHISYIDGLYMCVSAGTVTGLVTIESSIMSTLQQVLLFSLMCCGSTTFVSIVTIIIRRKFFKRKFDYLLAHNAKVRRRIQEVATHEAQTHPLRTKVHGITHLRPLNNHLSSRPPLSSNGNSSSSNSVPNTSHLSPPPTTTSKKPNKKPDKITADMVRRVDIPVRVNQMNAGGWLREEIPSSSPSPSPPEELSKEIDNEDEVKTESIPNGTKEVLKEEEQSSTPRDHVEFEPDTIRGGPTDLRFRRNHTFDPSSDHRINHRRNQSQSQSQIRNSSITNTNANNNSRALRRTGTYPPHQNSLYSDFGGLNPFTAALGFVKKLPVLQKFERSLTLPRTTTLQSVHTVRDLSATGGGGGGTGTGMERSQTVSYLTFDTVVGRNSTFIGLTRAQEEELGGVEFRALTLLLKIVIGYWFFFQMIAVLIIAPYLTYSKSYAYLFTSPPSRVNLNPTFFTFFQVWSAWSNNGMSLIDASMVPFYESYLFIIVLSILILAGNTAYPCFLRLVIYTISKIVPSRSQTKETLEFLLAHPRRCFLYLFPSHQTWFLVFVLCVLNGIDWVSFLVLDVGNKEIESLPIGTRIINGLIQSLAVRSAGFAITNIANLAPALQFLYSVMMYVAVYPIALSVRSTNVYEERSMGVFTDPGEDDNEAENRFKVTKSTSSYLAYHIRRQLSFDMWWLVTAVWLICIIERDAIQSEKKPWITIFTIIFECSSSYGTVGLSLGGAPGVNASLSSDLKTGSKLILILVMIRGRHRGLPLAIDRAILLPSDLEKHDDELSAEDQNDGEPYCESPQADAVPLEEREMNGVGVGVGNEDLGGSREEEEEEEEEEGSTRTTISTSTVEGIELR